VKQVQNLLLKEKKKKQQHNSISPPMKTNKQTTTTVPTLKYCIRLYDEITASSIIVSFIKCLYSQD
jgi:hypothetical protein